MSSKVEIEISLHEFKWTERAIYDKPFEHELVTLLKE